ncbi:MAG: TIGR02281 family clan AA aspartic protease [Pseudomonadota bacterium]
MPDMTGDDIANLFYLGLLAAALLVAFVASARAGMNRILQQMTVWALIFVGVIAAYGMWEDIRSTVLPQQSVMLDGARIELPRARDGHYYAVANINGTPTRFVVDTGATGVVLTKSAARKAGIDVDTLAYLNQAQTANGTVNIARTRVRSFGLPGAEIENFRVMVNEGEMRESLMGMSYLQTFSKIEIAGGQLVLLR